MWKSKKTVPLTQPTLNTWLEVRGFSNSKLLELLTAERLKRMDEQNVGKKRKATFLESTRKQIQRWRSGKQRATKKWAVKLREVLGLSYAQLDRLQNAECEVQRDKQEQEMQQKAEEKEEQVMPASLRARWARAWLDSLLNERHKIDLERRLELQRAARRLTTPRKKLNLSR